MKMNQSENDTLVELIDCDLLRQRFLSVYPVSMWKSNGFFEEKDLLDINCHWLQFEPIKPSSHFMLAIIYVIVFVIGSVSNTIVVYILVTSKKLLNPANILLVNLAISDLLIILLIPVFIYNSFLQGPAIGSFGCQAYGFLSGFSGTCSILSLAAVAIDRYLVISRPLDLAKKPTRTWSYITIGLIWLYSAVFASLPLFGASKYVPEGYLTSCSFDYLSGDIATRIFIFIYFLAAWLCPLVIIAYCYTAIVRAVHYVRRNVTCDTSPRLLPDVRRCQSQRHRQGSTHSTVTSGGTRDPKIINPHRGVNQPDVEVAIAKIVIGLVGTWLIAWTPYSVIALLGISGHAHLVTPFNSMLPALFAKMAACVDPFIYSLNHPKIRQEILLRLYNSFLLSTMGRRADSAVNSDSLRQPPEWKTSAARCSNRKALLNLSLVQQQQQQLGRTGSPASFRRVNKAGFPTPASGGAAAGSCASARDENRFSSSLSSAESRTGQAEELEVAVVMAEMMAQNDRHGHRHLNPSSSNNKTTYVATPREHIHINLAHLDQDPENSTDVVAKINVTSNIDSM